jgi:hypothetical protein
MDKMKKSKSMDKMPARKMPEGVKFPAAKKAAVKKAVEKTVVKAAAKKLVGPAAVEALQKRVSPAGVKKAEMDAKKAIAKKYPGLTKKKSK